MHHALRKGPLCLQKTRPIFHFLQNTPISFPAYGPEKRTSTHKADTFDICNIPRLKFKLTCSKTNGYLILFFDETDVTSMRCM